MRTLDRASFVEKFHISIRVRDLGLWGRREKQPPRFLARPFYETMRLCGATWPIEAPAFAAIAGPVIDAVFAATPRGSRPDAEDLVGRLYDALDAAGIEIALRPPVEAHGQHW